MTNQTCDMSFHPTVLQMHPVMMSCIGGCVVPHASFCIMFSWRMQAAQPHLSLTQSVPMHYFTVA